MGMKIDDAILCLKGIKQYGSDTFTKRSQGDWQNSLDLAIETMRKYQQIEQIVNAELEEYHPLDRNYYRLALIREVVEDGKID